MSGLTPYPHQIEKAERAVAIARRHGLAYLAMEERTGKSLTALLAMEALMDGPSDPVLVLTKKKALPDWLSLLTEARRANLISFPVMALNYHQAAKLHGEKLAGVILDEAHNYLSSVPKPGAIWQAVRPLTWPVKHMLYLSATPHAQGLWMLFHQFALTPHSPWNRYSYKNGMPNFYSWWADYGVPAQVRVQGGRMRETYHGCNEGKVWADVKHLFITGTRRELGHEFEPEDVKHIITLNDETRAAYNHLQRKRAVQFQSCDGPIVADSVSRLRAALHMLEGGTALIPPLGPDGLPIKGEPGRPCILKNAEKVRYILEHWGDSRGLVIMYHYRAERVKLERAFSKALLLQGTSFAEGVDLSGYDDLVIYSMDWSVARYSQRRARQANQRRDKPIHVHHLIVPNAISDQCYQCVTVKKHSFVDKYYQALEV